MAVMNPYIVRRRSVASSANGLDAALARLCIFEEQRLQASRWLHSYVLRESDGSFGLACVFSADHPRTLREHAQATGLPADEILRVTDLQRANGFESTLVHLVRRRRVWRDAAEARCAWQRARRIAHEPDLARLLIWLHSYTVQEDDDHLGSYCLYQAVDARLLADHAARAGMPATEITPVLGRIVYRDVPLEASLPDAMT